MRFDGLMERAKKKGQKLIIFVRGPGKPKIQSTIPDKDFAEAFAVFLVEAAKQFSSNSKGKYSPEDVLQGFFTEVKTRAIAELSKQKAMTPEERAMYEMADSLTKKAMEDLDDETEDDESDTVA